jgi:hypothetical protein
VTALRIDPDGTVTELLGTALEAGHTEFKFTTVVTCAAPFLPTDEVWVGVIDDFGAESLPLNRKAWGLYGRSPIYGPMFLGTDSHHDVPAEVAAIIALPLTEWPIPERAVQYLTETQPERPNMLSERPD